MATEFDFKPARDLGLTTPERINSILRERSIFSAIWLWLWWFLCSVVMRVYFRFEIKGKENLPKQLPYILVGNHGSHLDVIALMLAVPCGQRDRFFPLAAEDHFFKKTFLSVFTAYAINALPMPRKGGGHRSRARTSRAHDRCWLRLCDFSGGNPVPGWGNEAI